MENPNKQDLINEKNKLFSFFIRYMYLITTTLLSLMLLIPVLINYLKHNSLIMGSESYYHLANAKIISWQNFYYYPLHLINQFVPNNYLIIIPISLALISIILFFILAKKIELNKRFQLIFLTLMVLSPTFIYTYSTLSIYGLFIPLLLTGFILLEHQKRWVRMFSLIPFILITFLDIFSTIILLTTQIIYFYYLKKEKNNFKNIIIGGTTLSIIISVIWFKINFMTGYFQAQQLIPNLISDLGGISGLNIFVLLLATIGIGVAWQQKRYMWIYIPLLVLILGYFYNVHTIFYLSILLVFFSTVGTLRLFDRNWDLEILKKFTLLILVLGVLFSITTYLDRIDENSISLLEIEEMNWIKEYQTEGVIFSTIQESNPVRYFTEKEVFYEENNKKEALFKQNLTNTLIESTYLTISLPILDNNNISIIYLSKDILEKYPQDQGLLFLLKNENFKLIHFNEETQVWQYTKNPQ